MIAHRIVDVNVSAAGYRISRRVPGRVTKVAPLMTPEVIVAKIAVFIGFKMSAARIEM